MGSMSIMHWGVVLVIVMLLFGTKKLTSAGSDIGKAIKGFKDGLAGADEPNIKAAPVDKATVTAISVEHKPQSESL